jgi:small conductance mechanosensitive channel
MSNSSILSLFSDGFGYVYSWLSTNFNTIIFVLLVGFLTAIAARIVNHFMESYLKHMNNKWNTDLTTLRMFRHISIAIVYFIGMIIVIYSIPPLQSFSVALFTSAGVIGIIFGLAAQGTLSNIIAGLSLAIFQPFRVGDRLDVMNEYGKVTDLNLRHTVITTWDNRRVIVPNSKISTEAIINWTIEDPAIIWSINLGINTGCNIDDARKIMVEEARRNPNVMPEVIDDTKERGKIKVFVTGINYAQNITELMLQVWFNDRGGAFNSGCEIREAILNRFSEENLLKKS